jgi:23S rRNA (uracil1939-C5)-methyltransferase
MTADRDANTGQFEIELTAMAHGGSALGRWQGRTVFVPYTIPGEIVLARPVAERGRVVFAEGVQLLDASADRVYPRCPHFGPGRCGRCQWQHIDYAAQLLLKQDVLADQLERVGGFDEADVRPVIGSPQQWAYNHHMTLEAAPGSQFGFAAAQAVPTAGDGDAPALIVIDECHLLHPALLELYYTLDLDFSGVRRLRLQIGSGGDPMMIFTVTSEDDAPELLTDLPASVNLILPDNEPVNLVGDSHTRYEIGGRDFRVTAGSDFRANVSQLEALAALVLELAAPAATDAVLDLYGGVGFFGAFLAPHCALLTVVESYPPAATDADANLEDFDHVDIIEGSVEDIVPELEESYDIAVLDPPPAGLSRDALDALDAAGIRRLVYVSSDPATLARDLKRLVAKGYALGAVHPIDLNPQTYYIDAVAVLERA